MIEKSETLKAWAAGIVDGEGTLTIKSSGRDRKYLQMLVAIGNTDGRMIDTVHRNWGGYIHGKTAEYLTTSKAVASRPAYIVWFSDYDEIKSLLIDILPYLKTKQDHALVLLAALLTVGRPEEGMKRRKQGVLELLRPFYEKIEELDFRIHAPESPIQKMLTGKPKRSYS